MIRGAAVRFTKCIMDNESSVKVSTPGLPGSLWFVWGLLGVFLLLLGVMAIQSTSLRSRAQHPALPVYGQVPEFTLTNQLGQTITLADLRGRVWIADIIFTRCAGPCPQMTQRLSEVQAALPAYQSIKLVTLTTDPAYDTPQVLRKYAERFGAQPERWSFLTGTKREIAGLAIQGLKLTAIEKKPEERETAADLFIHTTIAVIVDKQGRMRGTFQTLEPEFKDQARAAIRQLLREP
jgi:protein SCO1/2